MNMSNMSNMNNMMDNNNMMGNPMMGMMGNQMNPMMGNPMMGNPMMGNQMNPMMGNPMMGNQMNPMMGNPMMGNQMNPMMGMMGNPMMAMMNNPMMAMMSNQMMMGNMGNNSMTGLNIDSQDPNAWNIIFEKKNGAQTMTIKATPDEKVQSLINKYKIKAGIKDNEEIKFIFNGKSLNFGLTLSQSGLQNASKITVLTVGDVEGA